MNMIRFFVAEGRNFLWEVLCLRRRKWFYFFLCLSAFKRFSYLCLLIFFFLFFTTLPMLNPFLIDVPFYIKSYLYTRKFIWRREKRAKKMADGQFSSPKKILLALLTSFTHLHPAPYRE
jgi:hypothetical protein